MATLVITQRKTEREMSAVWNTRDEFEQYKRNVQKFAMSMYETPAARAYIIKSLAADMQDIYSTRDDEVQLSGIEHLVCAEIAKTLEISRFWTIRGVLDEQSRQMSIGVRDPMKLADASMKSSGFSKLWRHRIAALNFLTNEHFHPGA